MLIYNVIDIKNKNAKSVLDLIRFSDCYTKKDIAEKTALSVATVSNLCNEMQEQGIISSAKISELRVGRTPTQLAFNYQKYHLIAIDLQVENSMGFAIVDMRNNILVSKVFDISHLSSPAEIVAFAKEQFDAYLGGNGSMDAKFIGVGISVPAIFDSFDERLIGSSIPVYERVRLKEMFTYMFNIPTYLDNCANFQAISEGAKKTCSNIVCMDISQGVGVGVICEGNLLRGKNGYATEAAHMPLGDPTRRCPWCGGYGCVETDLGVPNIIRQFPDIDQSLPLAQKWEQCVELFRQDTDLTHDLAGSLGTLAGKTATVLINLFDPEALCVTGYITDIFEYLYPHFIKEIQTRCYLAMSRSLAIEILPNNWQDIYTGIADAVYHKWTPLAE